jgi:hypothetical protein
MKRILTIYLFLMFCVFAGISNAQIPNHISFQGVLSDSDGMLLSGSYILTFELYSQPSGGSHFGARPSLVFMLKTVCLMFFWVQLIL